MRTQKHIAKKNSFDKKAKQNWGPFRSFGVHFYSYFVNENKRYYHRTFYQVQNNWMKPIFTKSCQEILSKKEEGTKINTNTNTNTNTTEWNLSLANLVKRFCLRRKSGQIWMRVSPMALIWSYSVCCCIHISFCVSICMTYNYICI